MSSRILLIDNYDSFVFNLGRYLNELGVQTDIVRNDQMTVDEIAAQGFSGIVISPGPRTPAEAGISVDVVRTLGARLPILGVCLGHQVIGAAFGGNIIRAAEPVHGRTSLVTHEGTGLFADCQQPLRVTRYHSLVVEEATLPAMLRVTARAAPCGTIMGLAHQLWPIWGVQFHPEAVLTVQGKQLLANFLKLSGISFDDSVKAMHAEGDLLQQKENSDDFYRQTIDPQAARPLMRLS